MGRNVEIYMEWILQANVWFVAAVVWSREWFCSCASGISSTAAFLWRGRWGFVHRDATAGRKNDSSLSVSHVNVLICSPVFSSFPLPVAPGFNRARVLCTWFLFLLSKEQRAVPYPSLVNMPTSHASYETQEGDPEQAKQRHNKISIISLSVKTHSSSQAKNSTISLTCRAWAWNPLTKIHLWLKMINSSISRFYYIKIFKI